jgi:hypothetical protein
MVQPLGDIPGMFWQSITSNQQAQHQVSATHPESVAHTKVEPLPACPMQPIHRCNIHFLVPDLQYCIK